MLSSVRTTPPSRRTYAQAPVWWTVPVRNDTWRCPLSDCGIDALGACPGFELEVATIRDGPGRALVISSCRHLASRLTARGFGPACHHPESSTVVADARTLRASMLGRTL